LVFPPTLYPTAGTGKRSGILRQAIQGALTSGLLDRTQPVHMIAHSMGDLDARRLISQDPTIEAGGDKVPINSLATIGTPHRGSPIADVVVLQLVPKLPVIAPVLAAAKIALGDVLGHFRIFLEGLQDLTTTTAQGFNTRFPNHLNVRYLSFAGGGRPGFRPTSGFFLPYYEFIRICDGEVNDGVVALSSAKWTGFDPTLWPGDHADEIGHDLDYPLRATDQATLNRYAEIVQRF
jgi:triacylglycerol lipase